MSTPYSYNKDEVIDAIRMAEHIDPVLKEELIDKVRQSEHKAFGYETEVVTKMEITPLSKKREGKRRTSICGHAVEKILQSLGAEHIPRFSSSIDIRTINDHLDEAELRMQKPKKL